MVIANQRPDTVSVLLMQVSFFTLFSSDLRSRFQLLGCLGRASKKRWFLSFRLTDCDGARGLRIWGDLVGELTAPEMSRLLSFLCSLSQPDHRVAKLLLRDRVSSKPVRYALVITEDGWIFRGVAWSPSAMVLSARFRKELQEMSGHIRIIAFGGSCSLHKCSCFRIERMLPSRLCKTRCKYLIEDISTGWHIVAE